MADARLAYVKVSAVAPGVYAGGLMVVDARGLPLDFKYTEPVVPSRLQQVLYGKSLDKHVRQDVIFRHLVERLDPRPALILVDEDGLLGLAAAAPLAYVVETRLAPLREVAALQPTAEGEWLLQVAETGSPLRFRLPKGDAGGERRVAELLLEAARAGLDPVEPFGRVRGALELVCAPSSAAT